MDSKPSEKNTVAEIKAFLDAQGVEYASSAKKADLLALV
ncbi:HeH/LEM domain-containing protein [Weissella coleopterorum]|nr:HeH/LEM domain-containing protein [Weissella coleopterorum]